MIKKITHPSEISSDMAHLATHFPALSKRVFMDVIQDNIGPESKIECPKDTFATVQSWNVQVVTYRRGKKNLSVIGQINLDIAFGYCTPQAYWAHQIPPPTGLLSRGAIFENKDIWRNAVTDTQTKVEDISDVLAIVLGEDTGVRTPTTGKTNYHEPPTKWHYLQDPVERHIDDTVNELADAVDQLILDHAPAKVAPPAEEAGYANWGE